MSTATTTSHARQMLERIERMPEMIGIPAPSSVSHTDYKVGFYADHSILIWSRHAGYVVLDESQTYYRDTVEHLARCLGTFDQARRAAMIGGEDKWIDGIHWAADGSYIGM